jgi:hypothetical protein
MWENIVSYASRVPKEVWITLGTIVVGAITGVHVTDNNKVENVSEKIADKVIKPLYKVELPGRWGIVYHLVLGTLPAIFRGILKVLPEQPAIPPAPVVEPPLVETREQIEARIASAVERGKR